MAVLSDAQREAGWTIAKLGDICAFVAGSAFPQKEQGKVSGDYPFAKVKDLQSVAGLSWRNIDNWIEESQLKTLKSKIIPVKSIVFAKIGEGLKRERFALSSIPMCIDNNLMAAVPSTAVNNIWLYYKFKTLNISSLVAGSALPYLRVQDLKDLDISLPPLEEQERIAGILGSLDDKIEANTRLIQTLKEYMTALYKAEAKNGKVLELTDIADFINGRAFTKDATGTGRVVIRIAELNNGLGASTVYNDIEVKEENTAYPGDVLMSWSGSLDTYVWHLPEAIINQHIFKVIPKGNYPKWLVYHACKSVIEDFQAIAVDKATTMGHIRRGDLKRDISIPAREMPQMENLWNLWMNLEQENLQLAETRDALIKRLIG
ncbi:restriction endonuclease subunit S [Rothia mucilaginosa]|uniref:restriction endonuclease subunit S n=1 Tax=Rothia mucilaginosa TaxID=43675 RepID=UPI0028EDE5BB|nr:restriction endonuclease subunit S [Rothia mucilaginosa]